MTETKIPVVRRNALTFLKDKNNPFLTVRDLVKEKTGEAISCRPIEDYNFTRGFLLPPAREYIQEIEKKGEPIHFLDAGAGFGDALKSAEAINPQLVRAHGLALNKPSEEKEIPKSNWTRGHFETTIFPGQFHVIQCHYALQHAINYTVAIENLLNSLRPGGKLFIYGDKAGRSKSAAYLHNISEDKKQKIISLLKDQGFSYSYRHFKPMEQTEAVEVFTRKENGKECDLRAFYEDYDINLLPIKRDAPKRIIRQKPKRGIISRIARALRI